MNCEIVRDLLPLYHDGVCSKESRAAVEEHLEHCEGCRRVLAELDAPLSIEAKQKSADDAAAMKVISAAWKRSKWRARVRGAVLAALVCTALYGGWYLLREWDIREVPADHLKVTELSQLSEGQIFFHLYVDDEYDLRRVDYDYEDGAWYIQPLRPLLCAERKTGGGLWDDDYIIDVEAHNAWAAESGEEEPVTRVYLGKGEDRILLWEEGMELPAASAENEARWGGTD